MEASNTKPEKMNLEQRHIGEFQRIMRVFFRRKLAVLGLIITLLFIITAVFAPLIAPYDPYAFDTSKKLQPPSAGHLLGTDAMGRDTLSRLIYGSRISLLVGIISVGIGSIVGQILGLVAAYFGGAVNTVIMRLMDAQMAFPGMLLMIVIAAVLGGGLKNVIIALSVSMIPVTCRLICGEALSVVQNDYITAARSMGSSNLGIMLIHVYPNCIPSIIVMMTIMMGTNILAEAGLSYLGLGVAIPHAAWGSMVNDGYRYLLTNPVQALAPGVAIMLLVFGFNLMGDGLRDALDPKLRSVI
ncbi:MAG: ABC transporter permease [Firmicutes bacterium]|nr:ABC transporter permease [Bacillota bacterium]